MDQAIDIVELSPALEGRYAEFARQDPASMIYGTLEFRAFLQRAVIGTSRYLVARRNDRIVGALPLFVAGNERWGEVVNSLPWYGSHGGCLVDSDDGDAIRAKLLARYVELIAGPRVAFATMILTPAERAHLDAYRRALAPRATDERIGQVTELPEDGPELDVRLDQVCRQKTRNLVRKSLKQGFELELADSDAAWRFLYETHVENMAAIGGGAKPLAHFEAMRAAIPPDWRQLVVTRLEGRPVAAMLLFRFNRTVEYITPVIKHEFRSMQPLSFAIWHAMLDAVRAGYRWWNWGGTWRSQVSLHHFKEGWGAVERPYTYLTHASLPAMEKLRRDRQAVSDAFPYYFIYPFSALEAR